MFLWELDFLKFLEGFRTGFLNFLFELITTLGEDTVIVLLMSVIYFMYDKNLARKIFFVTVISLGINGTLKNILRLPRPFANGHITCVRPETATGYSFPSGHTQCFATWGTAFAIELNRCWFKICIAILIVLTAFSRMYLGAHYPIDVIAGAALGVLCAFVFGTLYEKAADKNKLFAIALSAFTPFAIFFLVKPDLMYSDFFKFYGMAIGLFTSTLFEEKFVGFGYDCSVFKKILRVVLAVAVAYLIKELIGIFTFSNLQLALFFSVVAYFILTFVTLALLPLLFKKIKM